MHKGPLSKSLASLTELSQLLSSAGLVDQLYRPTVAVFGSQSCGKSSVLESIFGEDFLPRGSGVVTRRPLEINITFDPSAVKPFALFQQLPKRTFTNFHDVRDSIEELTIKVCGSNKQMSRRPIVLDIHSSKLPSMTFVDLPGLSFTWQGYSGDGTETAMFYASQPDTIVLTVVSANTDIDICEPLRRVRGIDQKGIRTLVVVTKVDIMDRGTDARSVLLNQYIPMKHGYVGMKNRNHEDLLNNVPARKGVEDELAYFRQHPLYQNLPAQCYGTQALCDKLASLIWERLKPSLLKLANTIQSQLQRIRLMQRETHKSTSNDSESRKTSGEQQLEALLKCEQRIKQLLIELQVEPELMTFQASPELDISEPAHAPPAQKKEQQLVETQSTAQERSNLNQADLQRRQAFQSLFGFPMAKK